MRSPDEDEPIAHLTRRCLPWRRPEKTECGRGLNDVKKVITREEAKTLIAKYGQRRSMFLLCMSCVQTSDRYVDWERRPSSVMERELSRSWSTDPLDQTDKELFAIAALIEAHREEFDGYLTGLAETVSLNERRASKRKVGSQRGGSPV